MSDPSDMFRGDDVARTETRQEGLGEASAIRLEGIAIRLEAIASR